MPYADRAQQNEYQRKRLAARRAAWLLANGPCSCGATEGLEVDHKDPAIKISHSVWSWSDGRRAAELAKCQALCVECHKVKTAAQRRARVVHGSSRMYTIGCRCDECRAGNARSKAGWRERTGKH